MGLFSRKPKPHPVITVDDHRIEYDVSHECWEFVHGEFDFRCHGAEFQLPPVERLNAILADVEYLMPEMRRRVTAYWERIPEVGSDTTLTNLSVDLSELASKGSFIVLCHGPDEWGDMVVEFTIKDGTIIEEEWSD